MKKDGIIEEEKWEKDKYSVEERQNDETGKSMKKKGNMKEKRVGDEIEREKARERKGRGEGKEIKQRLIKKNLTERNKKGGRAQNKDD